MTHKEVTEVNILLNKLSVVTAQRDRLREALKKIANFDDAPRYRVNVTMAYIVAIGAVNIARAALQGAGNE